MAEPRDLHDLYALAPEEFVPARDALARSLKERGDAGGAAAVKKLRRPGVAAWALNQLSRRERAGLDELVEARAEHLETQAEEVARRAEDARAEAARLGVRAEEARAGLDRARSNLRRERDR